MPPVAGRISWVRHLYKKIEEPISYIKVCLYFPIKIKLAPALKYFNIERICCHQQDNSDILCSPKGKDVVKMYNQTASALVESEFVYHRVWMDDVSKLDNGRFSGTQEITCY